MEPIVWLPNNDGPPVGAQDVTTWSTDASWTRGLELTLIAAVVGLMMALPLYLVGNMLTEKFELIAAALRRQNH